MKLLYTVSGRDIARLITAAERLVEAERTAKRARYSPGTKLRLQRSVERLLHAAGIIGQKMSAAT